MVAEFLGWRRVEGKPNIWNNGGSGSGLMVAVGRCTEFSDPQAQFVVRTGTSGDYGYKWIPSITLPSGEFAPAVRPESVSYQPGTASESSFYDCRDTAFITQQAPVSNQANQSSASGYRPSIQSEQNHWYSDWRIRVAVALVVIVLLTRLIQGAGK